MDELEKLQEDIPKANKFAQFYTKVRTGKVFLISLCTCCIFWVSWNLLPGLPRFDDPGFGRLTLILSIEASVATSMLIVANERQQAFAEKQMLYIQHLMEAQQKTLQGLATNLEASRTALTAKQTAEPERVETT